MGFQAWRQAGYQVRKSKKGIAIYAPMRFKAESNDCDEPTSRLRFRVAHVFDITQVDPMDAQAIEQSPSVRAVAPLTCLEKLKAFLVGHNLALEYAALTPGCYGTPTASASPARSDSNPTLNSAPSFTKPLTPSCTSVRIARTSPSERQKPRPSPTCSANSSD